MKRARPVPKGWASLPTGRFTGIDWSQADALHQSDPYLAWAETSGFAGFRSPLGQTAEPSHVPLLLELADEVSVLVSGRVIASGAPDAIRANIEVRRAYLGDDFEVPA